MKKVFRPDQSCWVMASAGSGKTKLLVDRYLSLLLSGCDVSKILCITFTNAAAQEMQQRIKAKLVAWEEMRQDQLVEELQYLGYPANDKNIQTARLLYNNLISNVNSWKIQTIHSYCNSLIQRFAYVLNIESNFTLMDDITYRNVARQVFRKMMKCDKENIKAAFKNIKYISDIKFFKNLVYQIIIELEEYKDIISQFSSKEEYVDITKKTLKVENLANCCVNGIIDEKIQQDLCTILKKFGKTEKNLAEKLEIWFSNSKSEKISYDFLDIFLTKNLEIRKKIVSEKFIDQYSSLYEILLQLQSYTMELKNNIEGERILRSNESLFFLIQQIVIITEEIKQKNNFISYDDLINLSIKIFEAEDQSIIFHINQENEHILVDEAQDTSFTQWQIILKIVQEFFIMTHEFPRSIFVVGDEKQSIFSFQGANPILFDSIKKYLSAQTDLYEEYLSYSYRSTPEILELVDKIFNIEKYKQSITQSISADIKHKVIRQNQKGKVRFIEVDNIFDLEKSEEKVNEIQQKYDDQQIMAEKIAQQIHTWITNSYYLEAKGRAIRPSDIMILIKTRTVFLTYLEKALYDHNISFTSPGNNDLKSDIIISDMIAILKFISLPYNESNLLGLLKSPLLSLSEEKIFEIVYGREKNLWEVLKEKYQQEYSIIEALINSTYYMLKPSEIIVDILYNKHLIDKFIKRNDDIKILNEFIDIAVYFEKTEKILTLQNFIIWFKKNDFTYIADNSAMCDNINITTIHGAKGLQSPVIILADIATSPKNNDKIFTIRDNDYQLIFLNENNKNDKYITFKNSLLKSQLDEYYRLLYVALTRAEDELYIYAVNNGKEASPETWYHILKHSNISI